MAAPIVHGPGFSTYVRTARLALEEKGVGYELREFNFLKGMPQEHLARHPFGKVPSFEHDGFSLYETAAITRYIDEAFSGPKLQPGDVRLRARMAQIIGVLDSYTYGPMVNKVVIQRLVVPMVGGTADENIIEENMPAVRRTTEVLEGFIGEGDFLAGDQLSLADLHLAPMFAYFAMTPEAGRLLEERPRLRRWWAAMSGRASVTATQPQFG
jgi:glutathione S-transferase